jgi:transcriptional regulator with XRE-family HTH domain
MTAERGDLQVTLGQAIRQRRTAAKLRLIDLAEKIGVSSSYLSQIERDRISPSVTALGRIAEGLSTTVAALFESTESSRQRASPVVRRTQRKVLIYPDSQTRNELLTPHLSGALEVLWSTIPPGTKSPVFQHDGEECGVVLKGELAYFLGDERFVLRAGDSITYRSRIPHWYENRTARVVEAIWVETPPSF